MKKFKLTSEFIVDISGVKLFRIKALIEFGNVKAGDLGGYIEKEENLSHMGDAWVSDDARISGNAQVFGKVCSCRCGSAHTYDVNGHRADDAAVGIGSGLFCFGDILSTGRRLIY